MKIIINFLLYIWQLPQNLLGLVLVAILRPEYTYYFCDGRLHYAKRMRGGISLGRYIIVNEQLKDYTGRTERHEYGHCRQSQMLGPLYLPIIGLPSLLHAAFYRYDQANPSGYYRFYTERWADKLGGVER